MGYTILDQIEMPNDIKKISKKDYRKLAKEIRHFLIEHVSKTGGHLASNLGVVELTMALHMELFFPKDQLIWDVGHQSYVHKILTGRKKEFKTLRSLGGLSGFPKRKESECDAFDTGHSSTSVSAALGMAAARDLKGGDNKVVAVIGDGALSGGMAYEALNNAARMKSNLMIVLNDNNMSISENVGGMAAYLGKIRTNHTYQILKDDVEQAILKVPMVGDAIVSRIKKSKDSLKRLFIPGMLFEDMGLTYIGPIDGHNIEQLRTAFQAALKMNEAVMVHVVTKKGKGYSFAEQKPSNYHGVDPFEPRTGQIKSSKKAETYTQVFSDHLRKLARKDEKIVAVTAAMPSGTGLIPFQKEFPTRFFDVGIAEEHAVTFAAGMAAAGLKPVFAVYSTFLQRAFDQMIHDVCIEKLPVVFAVDRAGLVGNDGETHQGIFDLSYLSLIPELTIMAPANKVELEEMLTFAFQLNAPVCIRYPRGEVFTGMDGLRQRIQAGKSQWIVRESKIALLFVGSMAKVALEVKRLLIKYGYPATIVNVRFIKPMDEEMLYEIAKNHEIVVTLEENIATGGFGQMADSFFVKNGFSLIHINASLPEQFIEQGDTDQLLQKYGLYAEEICSQIRNKLKGIMDTPLEKTEG